LVLEGKAGGRRRRGCKWEEEEEEKEKIKGDTLRGVSSLSRAPDNIYVSLFFFGHLTRHCRSPIGAPKVRDINRTRNCTKTIRRYKDMP